MCFDGLYTTLRCVGARSACCVVRIPPAILSRSTNGRSIDHQSLSIVMSNTHKSLLYSLRTSTRTGRHLCFISPISIRLFHVKCPSIAKRNNHNPISGVKSRTNPDMGPNGGGTHVTMTGALHRTASVSISCVNELGVYGGAWRHENVELIEPT